MSNIISILILIEVIRSFMTFLYLSQSVAAISGALGASCIEEDQRL